VQRASSFQYAMLWLPANVRNDYGLRDQWMNNNLTYLDSLLLELYQDKDDSYMRCGGVVGVVPGCRACG